VFSKVYRKRSQARIARLDPWFPSHPERDAYITLLQLQPPPSEVLLKAALLRRAVADVRRIMSFREDKAALQNLLQKGSVGDDLWNAFTAAEKELEAEIVEVVNEANSFREGWGSFIFASASEVVNNLKQREALISIPKMREEAAAKYGGGRPSPTILKTLASSLAVPSPQTSAPHSPKIKPATVSNGSNGASGGHESPSPTVTPARSISPSVVSTLKVGPTEAETESSAGGTSASTSPLMNGNASLGSPKVKASKTPGSKSKSRKRK